MPTVLVIALLIGAVLLLAAVLPRLELWAPRRYADIVYVRLRRRGARIDVWQGKPVQNVRQIEFDWSDDEQSAFGSDGVPDDVKTAARVLQSRMRPLHRRFPFGPVIVLHPIEKAMHGLDMQDRKRLAEMGEILGDKVMIGDLPNAFPERAFQEIRAGAAIG